LGTTGLRKSSEQTYNWGLAADTSGGDITLSVQYSRAVRTP